MNTRVVVGIVERGGQVLLVRRRYRDGGLRWTFPGGSIEPMESDREAVIREVREEAGVLVHAVRLLGERQHPDTDVDIEYWLCQWLSGEARVLESRTIDRVRWVLPGEVNKLITTDMADVVRDELEKIAST